MNESTDMNEITHSWFVLEVTLVTTLMTTRMLYLIR